MGFYNCDRLSNLTQLGFKSSISQPAWHLMDELAKKTIGRLFYTTSSFVHYFRPIGEFKLELQSGNDQFGAKLAIFVSYDLEIWQMTTLKNNRAPLPYYVKFCASFQSHGWIQTRVTAQKRSIRVKLGDVCPFDLEIWQMHWKTIWHLFYTTLSFVHHFKVIGEFKLSYCPETLNSGQNRQFCVPCDLQIWWMTLKNNRPPLLCSSMLLQALCLVC